MNKDKLIAYINQRKYEIHTGINSAVGSKYDTERRLMANRLDELLELEKFIQSEPEETRITYPCNVGDTVYTIGVNTAPCEKCSHGEEVNYDASGCLFNHEDYECPPPEYYIESHVVEGFKISSGGIELVEEWGYDCKHIFEPYFLTWEEAETALSKKAGE